MALFHEFHPLEFAGDISKNGCALSLFRLAQSSCYADLFPLCSLFPCAVVDLLCFVLLKMLPQP